MATQAGKGPETRKGTNFEKLRAGYDTINWGDAHETRKADAAQKAIEREEREQDENTIIDI